MSLKDDYEIDASPKLHTITPGAKVTYSCVQKVDKLYAADSPREWFKWYCVLDRTVKKWYGKVSVIEGPYGYVWETEWETLGKHTIKCCITLNKTRVDLEYPQWIDTVEAVLGSEMEKQKGSYLPDPWAELSVVTRYIGVLEEAEKFFPITDLLKKTDHDKRVEQLKTYRDKLAERLASTEGKQCAPKRCIPVVTTHLETSTQQKTGLRVFVSKVRTEPAEPERIEDKGDREWRRIPAKKKMEVWELVDWTNPAHRSLTGTYEGRGETDEKAIRDAIAAWDDHNRYPDGTMMYEVHKEACGKEVTGKFSTDGSAQWDSIRTFFEWVGLGAAVIAGIVTLLAPEPGSKVVSAAIWTAIFSSTTAAVINIGQRWDEGFSNWKEESMDGLTILGNIFTAGQMQWVRRADVIVNTTRTGASVRANAAKFALIGQVGTDGVQGILVASEHIGKYETIMQDQSLTPEERSTRLLELFRSMSVDGVMLYVNMKGTKADLENLKSGKIETDKLNRLKEPFDPSKPPVDLTEPVKVKGDTKDGKLVTKVQDEQIRLQKETEPQRTKFQDALPPENRGMRKSDDFDLSDVAKESGNIILVRNSNPDAMEYIGKPGYKAKPEELKAKTRKTPPNTGLAAADPSDSKLQELLKENKMSYENYKANLEKQGYNVGGLEEGYIVRDNSGNAFYSDYDLHGVYKAETGQNAYNDAFKEDLNGRFGEKVVQHGPHDLWPSRNSREKAGPNRGPQPPVTAYLPDGSSVHLQTIEDMKKFYKGHNINWKEIYPDD